MKGTRIKIRKIKTKKRFSKKACISCVKNCPKVKKNKTIKNNKIIENLEQINQPKSKDDIIMLLIESNKSLQDENNELKKFKLNSLKKKKKREKSQCNFSNARIVIY